MARKSRTLFLEARLEEDEDKLVRQSLIRAEKASQRIQLGASCGFVLLLDCLL